MDKSSSVAISKDVLCQVLRFKLSRRKFINGRLETWKMEVDMKNESVVVTYTVNSILINWEQNPWVHS